MSKRSNYMSISETAKRTGVAASALRFYESKGLIQSVRSVGNQRQFHRSMLRKISVIQVAQSLGLSLREIAEAFETLPDRRTPTKKDWERLSSNWKNQLDDRIGKLQRLRENLSGCIGCGCLSLKRCALYNVDDVAAAAGPGPRYLIDENQEG